MKRRLSGKFFRIFISSAGRRDGVSDHRVCLSGTRALGRELSLPKAPFETLSTFMLPDIKGTEHSLRELEPFTVWGTSE